MFPRPSAKVTHEELLEEPVCRETLLNEMVPTLPKIAVPLTPTDPLTAAEIATDSETDSIRMLDPETTMVPPEMIAEDADPPTTES